MRPVDHPNDNLLLEQMNDHYAELRADDSAWSEFLAEQQAWDRTLLDGLTRAPR